MMWFFGNLSKLLIVGTRGRNGCLGGVAIEAAEGPAFIVG